MQAGDSAAGNEAAVESPPSTIPVLLAMSFHSLPYSDSSICAVVWWAWAVFCYLTGRRGSVSQQVLGGAPSNTGPSVPAMTEPWANAHSCLGAVGHCRVSGDDCHLTRHVSSPWASTLSMMDDFSSRDNLLEVLDQNSKLGLQVVAQSWRKTKCSLLTVKIVVFFR